MRRAQRNIVIALWLIVAAAGATVLGMHALVKHAHVPAFTSSPAGSVVEIPISGDSSGSLPILYPTPKFTLTDQTGNPFSNSQLHGHVWVADFIFTTCASLCPTMSARMEQLQKQLPDSVHFVSFSVDPEHDTPAALATYAQLYHADPSRWTFLTCKPEEQFRVIAAMKIAVMPASGGDPIQHSPYFLLIDANGNVRADYDGGVNANMEQLISDAATLQSESVADASPPAASPGKNP